MNAIIKGRNLTVSKRSFPGNVVHSGSEVQARALHIATSFGGTERHTGDHHVTLIV